MRSLDAEGNMPHHQCSKCNKMTYGPHTDENPGKQITYVSPEGEMVDDPAVPLDERNVSHGMCRECREAWKASYEQFKQDRAARQRTAEDGGNSGANG